MDKWKAIALVSASFSAGMIYTTACADKPGRSPMDAHAGADDTGSGAGTAPPSGGGAGRAVLTLFADESALCTPVEVFEYGGGGGERAWIKPVLLDATPENPSSNDPTAAWGWDNGQEDAPPEIAAPACSCPVGFSYVGWEGRQSIVCLED